MKDNKKIYIIIICIMGAIILFLGGYLIFDKVILKEHNNIKNKAENIINKIDEKINKSELNDKKICTLVKDNGDEKVSIGDEYKCNVNNTNTFIFYVLSIEEDQVNLIMNQNICNDGTLPTSDKPCTYAWHWHTQSGDEDDNKYGPDIAMTNLYKATKNWTNIPDMIMNYEDEQNKDDITEGYKTIITNKKTKITTITGKQEKNSTNQTFGNLTEPLKARLPKLKEVEDAGCLSYENGSCPKWLVENLENASSWCSECSTKYADTTKILNISGYWLLSSPPIIGDSSYALNISNHGIVHSNPTSYDKTDGVRAVITISKSNL